MLKPACAVVYEWWAARESIIACLSVRPSVLGQSAASMCELKDRIHCVRDRTVWVVADSSWPTRRRWLGAPIVTVGTPYRSTCHCEQDGGQIGRSISDEVAGPCFGVVKPRRSATLVGQTSAVVHKSNCTGGGGFSLVLVVIRAKNGMKSTSIDIAGS